MARTTPPQKLRFNKTLIEGLEPPEPPADRYYIYDTLAPSLCICVTATGRKTFYSYRRIDGKPERQKLGRWPQLTVDGARDEVARINGQVADGENPAEKRRTVRATMTLGELWTHYLDTHAKPRKRSWKADEWLWTKFLEPWKERKLNQIKRGDVQALHATLGKTSVYNANRTRSLLLKMFNVAADAGYEGENPVSRVKKFSETKRERFLSADELKRLFAALDGESNQVVADAIRFGLWTGGRRGNWLSARWDEIDQDRKVWTIPATKAKSKRPMVVPLPPQAMQIVERRRNAPDASPEWVFPGRKAHAVDAKSVWNRVRTAANLADARMHDLRRTLATFAVSAGVPLFQVAKLLGHETVDVTESVYARSQDDVLRLAADTAAMAIAEAAKPKAKPKRKAKGGGND